MMNVKPIIRNDRLRPPKSSGCQHRVGLVHPNGQNVRLLCATNLQFPTTANRFPRTQLTTSSLPFDSCRNTVYHRLKLG
jgi:hypothetical protein